MIPITIFTPTYNRRVLIERLYQSLLSQTTMCFEWIVVDDGSTDDTEVFFNQTISQETPFPIRYFKQKNGGKHRAINYGVQKANGELFFTVDSDDYLTKDAIEKVIKWKKTLDNSHKWAGIAGLRGYTSKEVVGERNNSAAFVDAKNTERRKLHLEGDKAEVYFTKILQMNPFPEIPGENFMSEEIVWNKIARKGYHLRWFNDIIYICNYLEDGLTKDNTKDRNSPKGRLLWAKGQIKSFPDDWRKRYLAIAIYHNAVKHKKNIRNTSKDLSISFVSTVMATLFFMIYNLIQSIKGRFK